MKINKGQVSIIILLIIIAFYLSYILTNLHHQGFNFINKLTALSNDNSELFTPSDNLIKFGKYSIDKITPYTDRIPGISLIYIPLRYFFSQKTAFTLLTLFPLLIYLIGILYIHLKFSKKTGVFFSFCLSLCIVLLTPFHYFFITAPESYSVVFTLFGFITLFDFFPKSAIKKYLLSGFFFMMAATFRGYLLPSVLALSIFLFVFHLKTNGLKSSLSKSSIFIIPLFLYLCIWTTRNYLTKSEIIVLQTNERGFKSTYKQSTQETKKTLKIMGFETVEFHPGSPVNYILGRTNISPDNFFNEAKKFGIEKSEIDSIRKLTIASYQLKSPTIENKIIEYNKELRKKIKNNNNIFTLYLLTPLKNFSRSFFFNFTSQWGLPAWKNANTFEKAFRILVYILFHLSFAFSLFLSIYSILKKQNLLISLSWLIWTSSMFFTYTYLLNIIEFKYFFTLFTMTPIVIAYLIKNLKPEIDYSTIFLRTRFIEKFNSNETSMTKKICHKKSMYKL